MKLNIESKKENPLQDRTEVVFTAEHTGEVTPGREAIQASIASAMSVPKERVVVDHMDTEYGIGISKGYAKVYSNPEAIKKSERYHQLVRNKIAEKKVKEKAAPKQRAAPKHK
ncbi:MAG: 30S ribosomal protein S24e [Methanomassiliicoccales archaeon]